MAIASNFPSSRPSLLLDFASVGRLDPRVTYSRASSGTYYDGVTTAKAEENLVLQSQTFNTTWVPVNGTVTANTDTAPDGTLTADTFSATSADAVLGQTINYGDGGDATFSIWVKRKTGTGTVSISHTINSSATSVSVDGTWQRFSVTTALSSGSRTLGIKLDTSGDEVYVWGAQLEVRSSMTAYTATTTQPITNYIPVLQTAAAGVARFQHTPTTGAADGLFIEEQRTNSLTYSEDFSDSDWSKTRSSITSNTIVAPDGTLTGDKLVEDTTASNTHLMTQNVSLIANTVYTASVYVKAGERTRFRLQNASVVNWATVGDAYFDLSAGTVISGTGTITPVGNGWYRCSITGTFGGSNASGGVNIILVSTGTTTSYTGDGYSGIYLWGADLEAGGYPTSYIPTTSASVTRNADAASMVGTNFSDWYNAAEGTLYAEANTPESAATYVFADMNSNSLTNYIRQSTASNGTSNQLVLTDNGAITASPSVTVTLGSMRKMAGAYIVNSVQQSVNGSLGTEDSSATVPAGLTQLNIGSRSTGANAVNGTIRKIAYYPQRLTNAQLQALTG